jgi:DNA helicase-4
MHEWSPSTWGRRFTGAGEWALRLDGTSITLVAEGSRHTARLDGRSPLVIRQGVFWTDLALEIPGGRPVRVDGIPNRHGSDIAAAIDAVLVAQRVEAERRAEEERRITRQERTIAALSVIRPWREGAHRIIGRANSRRWYLTTENLRAVTGSRPALTSTMEELLAVLQEPELRARLGADAVDADKAVRFWGGDHAGAARRRNGKFMTEEIEAHRDLFNSVESRPLTDEQARAVVCFDNRVQVVAAAGSGKTSTMVAKAAYAIRRGLVSPDRIVMLAFNQAAAAELQERAARAFARVGLNDVSVEAKTFHSLGAAIIGKGTGRKRHVPLWAKEKKEGIAKLAELIDGIRDRSPKFAADWDMFRIVFGRDIPPFGEVSPDEEWDPRRKRGSLRTLRGEPVKSAEEVIVANWLFYNGVDYVYEKPYEFDTVTTDHAQYRPDFFYPAIGLYHEHFALDRAGNPPPQFKDYAAGVQWKRATHTELGTDCIETTSSQLWSGRLFEHLAHELTRRGLQLDPNPYRPVPRDGQAPVEDSDLIGLMRSFICHAKGNALDNDALAVRLGNMGEGAFTFRHRLFLRLAKPVRAAWDKALSVGKEIDFEDMLIQAAELVEAGRFASPYDLVLADEFQDASWARARLCLALVNQPGRHLFAVGDDWQSINRFAGADISVMTGFADWCGGGEELRLEQTFRCPQRLCDAAGEFVTRNPAQIKKRVRSDTPDHGAVLTALQVTHKDDVAGVVAHHLARLAAGVRDGTIAPGKDGRVTVFVLGRYNNDKRYVPENWHDRFGAQLVVSFSTIHTAKGMEADYVVLPGMVRHGFPSERPDDPVLTLAMPGGDAFHLSEERRLFYVALTRARRSVAMITVRGEQSVFLDELVKDGRVTVTNVAGEPVNDKVCPACRKGVLVVRAADTKPFIGCTGYPRCRHTQTLPGTPPPQRPGPRRSGPVYC